MWDPIPQIQGLKLPALEGGLSTTGLPEKLLHSLLMETLVAFGGLPDGKVPVYNAGTPGSS